MSDDRTATGPPGRVSPAVAWRRDRLLGVGFAHEAASELAMDLDTDLHAVLELVEQGCPPDLAARILAPLEGPR